ncbi:MAG: imelysin family protein [Flavobacteriales bacterium]
MNRKKNFIPAIALSLSLLVVACNKDDKADDDNGFDRTIMLRNYAENLVIPAFKDLQTTIIELQQAAHNFINEVNLNKLELLQQKWVDCYQAFQYTNAYNFGPAGEQGLNRSITEEIATFPVSENKVDQILNGASYSFSDFNRDARGLLTVEYLIYGKISQSNTDVIQAFAENANRRTYLLECIANAKTRVDNVVNAWSPAYINQFVSNSGTAAGSSTSQFYNEFVKSYETIKNFKIELPMGLRPGQMQPEPRLVEAYYSGKTLDMIKAHLGAIENIYHGRTKTGVDGVGFKEYLENVINGKQLVTSTLQQLETINTTLNAIPTNSPVSEQIISSPAPLEAFRVELQRQTRFFKSDMSSLLGIAITYSSGDGD